MTARRNFVHPSYRLRRAPHLPRFAIRHGNHLKTSIQAESDPEYLTAAGSKMNSFGHRAKSHTLRSPCQEAAVLDRRRLGLKPRKSAPFSLIHQVEKMILNRTRESNST